MRAFENAESWVISDCWVACFDILGFRNLMSVEDDDSRAYGVRVDYEETIENLENSCREYEEGALDYCWFSDTFLMFTPDDSASAYCVIQFAAKHFIEHCIYSRIPMRGAISVGSFMRTRDNRSFIGKAFLEAFEYAEDQDWIGLLITPTAMTKAAAYGLSPTHHDFVRSKKIPMRKFSSEDVVAYRFQNGRANFPCPLLPMLRDMKLQSEERHRPKYERAEEFIEEHYRWVE
jgi:hypothetical protein